MASQQLQLARLGVRAQNLGRSATEAQLGFDCEHEFKFGVELEFSLEFEFGLDPKFNFEFGFELELDCESEFEFEFEL